MRLHRLFAIGLLLPIFSLASTFSDHVLLTPVEGWSAESLPVNAPFPTAVYAPDDGRNAKVLLTLFPNSLSQVSDLATLRKFHRVACIPLLPTPDAEIAAKESTMP